MSPDTAARYLPWVVACLWLVGAVTASVGIAVVYQKVLAPGVSWARRYLDRRQDRARAIASCEAESDAALRLAGSARYKVERRQREKRARVIRVVNAPLFCLSKPTSEGGMVTRVWRGADPLATISLRLIFSGPVRRANYWIDEQHNGFAKLEDERTVRVFLQNPGISDERPLLITSRPQSSVLEEPAVKWIKRS